LEGMRVLQAGGRALDAVERGIGAVEDDPAVATVGLGGAPNLDGVCELDASIMDGETLRSGAVGALRNIRHPISVARKVMERTPHVLLVGEGALGFARSLGFREEAGCWKPGVREKWKELRRELEALNVPGRDYLGEIAAFLRARVEGEEPAGTVSAVAVDGKGNVASGNSTTGLIMKLPGRVGDSAVVGAGVYADNGVGGASTTGIGEVAMTYCLSKRICDLMAGGLDPQRACEKGVMETVSTRGRTGEISAVALDRLGRPGAATSRKRGFEYAFFSADMEEPEMREVFSVE